MRYGRSRILLREVDLLEVSLIKHALESKEDQGNFNLTLMEILDSADELNYGSMS